MDSELEDALKRIQELEAENKRLKSRGIEDMRHRIKELEAALGRLLATVEVMRSIRPEYWDEDEISDTVRYAAATKKGE
jgi:predicted RNase H-like nuclease (RuvC/YqgF family)